METTLLNLKKLIKIPKDLLKHLTLKAKLGLLMR